MSRIVIIGAGVSGLASAALLARDGHDVMVLETRLEVGGRSGSWVQGEFRFDLDPSWYAMPEVVDHFYRLLGTTADEELGLVTLDPGFRIYFESDSTPIDVPASREEARELFEGIQRGEGERLDRYLDAAQQSYEFARAHFLYSPFPRRSSSLAPDLADGPGVFARLFPRSFASLIRASVGHRRLRQILGFPAMFYGSSPYALPSMYHLASYTDLAEGVLYPMGGLGAVVSSIERLAAKEGATIRTGTMVSRIVVERGVARGVEYVERDGTRQFLDADLVVSAADLHHTETHLLRPNDQTFPEESWKARPAGSSALVLCLGVSGELPQLEHHTVLIAKAWRQGFNAVLGPDPSVPLPSSLYIRKASGVDPDAAPEGHENLLVFVPVPADPSIGRGDVDGDGDTRIEILSDKMIRQIAAWTGIDDLESRITLRRTIGPGNFAQEFNVWRGAIGPPRSLRAGPFPRRGRSLRVRGLYYAQGSSLAGTGIPSALVGSEVLVKRLRGDRSHGPLDAPMRSSAATAALVADRVERANAAMAASRAAAVATRAARAASVRARTAAARTTLSRGGGAIAAGTKKAMTSARGFAATSSERASVASARARVITAAARARLDQARADRLAAGAPDETPPVAPGPGPDGVPESRPPGSVPQEGQENSRPDDPEPGAAGPGLPPPDPSPGPRTPYWMDPNYDPDSSPKER